MTGTRKGFAGTGLKSDRRVTQRDIYEPNSSPNKRQRTIGSNAGMPRKSPRKAAGNTAHYRVPVVRRRRKRRAATMEQRAYLSANMAAPPGVRAVTRASGEGGGMAVTPTSEAAAQPAPTREGDHCRTLSTRSRRRTTRKRTGWRSTRSRSRRVRRTGKIRTEHSCFY